MEISDPALEVDGLRHVTVFSRALQRRADCTVWVPRGHVGPLPLVVLLHGVYGSHWGWAFNGDAHRTAQRLIDGGEIPPVAIAMPSDGLFGHGSGYLPHSAGDFESWILDDVPVLAAAAVQGVDASATFALAGLSMGGFGALVLGARRPDRISSVAALSAITDFEQMRVFVGSVDAYDVPDSRRSAELVWRGCLTPPPLYLACGSSDILIAENRALHQALEEAGVAHTWVEDAGGHEWSYWRAHVADVLRFCTLVR